MNGPLILSPNGDGTWLSLLVVDGEVVREALYIEDGDGLTLLCDEAVGVKTTATRALAEHPDGTVVPLIEGQPWPEAVWSKPGTWTLRWLDDDGGRPVIETRYVPEDATGPLDVRAKQ